MQGQSNSFRQQSSTETDPPSVFMRVNLRAETLQILVGLCLLILALSLFSFHPSDAGWSTTGRTGGYYNWLGAVGAWFSDVLLYALGRSVWVLWAVVSYWWALSAVRRWRGSQQPVASVWAGLALAGWVCISCVLEALRLNQWSGVALPYGAGGVLGFGFSKALMWVFSERWLVMFCLIAWLGCAALTLGLNWLSVSQRVGVLWDRYRNQQAAKQDLAENMALGQQAQAQRHAQLSSELTEEELNAPLNLEVRPSAPVYIPPYEVVDKATEKLKAKAAVQAQARAVQPVLFEAEPEPQAEPEGEAEEARSASFMPSLGLLDPAEPSTEFVPRETLEYTSRLIEKKLRDYNVTVKVVAAQAGPVVTRYEIEPADGVKGSQIVNLARDLARSLSLTSIRVVETIPGRTTMGLELPNPKRQMVRLSEILGSKEFVTSKVPLTMALGKDITGEPIVMNLALAPHLLVAGTTGSGKSVGINAMILSLLYKAGPEQVRLILIDPKMLELSVYEGIPHLLAPVVTDMKQAAHAVNWAVAEMERRYKIMSKLGVRGVAGYNEKLAKTLAAGDFLYNPFSLTPEDPEPLKPFPHIVLVVDELADLLMVVGKKIEEPLARLAQKSRACGIHMILATQRPSADVLTGLIRSNVPARIAFQVSSKTDSRIILDQGGADALLGNGDMLYLPKGSIPTRVHGAFVSDEEVVRIAQALRDSGAPDYVEGILDGDGTDEDDTQGNDMADNDAEKDPLYDKAVEIVLVQKKASISNVQRQLRVGYQRAARMIDAMEKAGIISAPEHNGNRTVLAKNKLLDF